MLDALLRRSGKNSALPAISAAENALSGKKKKLSPRDGVYSGDAVGPAPSETTDEGSEHRAGDQMEEAAQAAVAIAFRKTGALRPAPPMSAPPVGPSTASRGGAVGGDASQQLQPSQRGGSAEAASPSVTMDDDRGLTFEQIHKKYEAKIYSLILRFVGDREDAEDLTVETFVNAYRHWDRFRGEARIYTWLYQIAINNCKNRFKQRDRRREREPISLDDAIETDSGELSREVADWRNAPEQLLMDKEFAARLRRAVDALKPEYKEVFVLAEMEDMSYEDIARVTRLTVPAVKTRLHRARNMIKQRLEPYYRD